VGSNFESHNMDETHIIAAILTAGMLPTKTAPRPEFNEQAKVEELEPAVDHAVRLFQLVAEALGSPR
jgi:hypothetical protein